MPSNSPCWDEETDLPVFGRGAGGLAATRFAGRAGLQFTLGAKWKHLGETTATSGGRIGAPGTKAGIAEGETVERARMYRQGELGRQIRPDLIDAGLASGGRVVTLMQKPRRVDELARTLELTPH